MCNKNVDFYGRILLGGKEMNKVIKIVVNISFIFYLFALVVLLFFGYRGVVQTDQSLVEYLMSSSNFVPFKTISTYMQAIFDGSMNRGTPIKNLFGNALMFLPMGIYLPYFIRKINKISVFSLSMVIVLFIIEVIQLITRRGRFDIDDLLLNMLGALIGFSMWKLNFMQKLINTNSTRTKSL